MKCKGGKHLFSTLNRIREEILNLNNNSLAKSIKYVKKEINNMKKNTDLLSQNNLEKQKNMIINILICKQLVKDFTTEQIKNFKKYIKLIRTLEKQYNLNNYNQYYPEVFYYKHGIIYFNDKLLNYIYNRDIMDIGAWIGDSLIVLGNYTSKYIYSYEISSYNINQINKNLELNNCQKYKHKIIHKGLSDNIRVSYIVDNGNAGVGIDRKGYLKVDISTIDEEVKVHNMTLGFIKADVERNGLELVRGAKKTILKYLPILSISIYHNLNEYINIRKYLDNLTSLYSYKYVLTNFCEPYSCEFSLIAYPKNII